VSRKTGERACRNRESSLLETYHSDSFMAKKQTLGFLGPFFMKRARSNFLIHLQTVQIEFRILMLSLRHAYMNVEVTERACRVEVMSLHSHCHRPAHIFAFSDNKPIVLPDKASVCTVMGIKQGISHGEIG